MSGIELFAGNLGAILVYSLIAICAAVFVWVLMGAPSTNDDLKRKDNR